MKLISFLILIHVTFVQHRLQICEASQPARQSAAPQTERCAGGEFIQRQPLHLLTNTHAEQRRGALQEDR